MKEGGDDDGATLESKKEAELQDLMEMKEEDLLPKMKALNWKKEVHVTIKTSEEEVSIKALTCYDKFGDIDRTSWEVHRSAHKSL